jgi:CHAT domain-containing protein
MSHVLPPSQDASVINAQNTTQLQSGKTITREITGGATHAFETPLLAGQYMRLVVEQHGINLVATLLDSDGWQIVQMDNPAGGHGPIYLSLIASVSGDYRLQIRSIENWANAGQYDVSIEELRERTTADRDRVAAENAFADGRQLATKATKESRQAAIKKYEEALAHWRNAGDQHWQALTLYSIGGAYRRLGQLRTASEFFERIMPLQLAEHDWRLIASSLNDRGLNFSDMGEHERALESLNQAFKLYQDHGDRRGQASAFNNIGLSYHRIGALREAVENYQKAIPLRQAENDQVGEFNVRNNIGGIYDVLGEPFKALEQYQSALKVWQDLDKLGQHNNRDQLGIGFNNVGEAQNKLGDWQQGLENYERALAIFQATGNSQREAACLDNLGQLYLDLGDPALAQEYYKKAQLLLQQKVKDPDAEGNVLNHIGTANLFEGKLSDALEKFQAAFKLRQSPRGQAYALINLGAVYALQNNPREAVAVYDNALALFSNSGDRQGEAATLYKRGEAHGLLLNESRALEDFTRALSLWRSIANRRGEATTLLGIARAKAALDNPAEAVKDSEAALAIIESLRTNVSSNRLRISYFATQQDYYELNIELNMRLFQQDHSAERLADALRASEGSRARSLIDMLNVTRVGVAEGVGGDLIKREREIQQALNAKSEAQTRLLNSKHSAQQADEMAAEMIKLIAAYDEIKDRIRAVSPKYIYLTQPQPLTLAAIQNQLDHETVLLEYLLGDKHSYLWAVTPHSIDGFELPARDQIEPLARRVTEALTARNRLNKVESRLQKESRFARSEQEYAKASAELSNMILAPAAALLGQKRLVIVADGALQSVPFVALPVPVSSVTGETMANSSAPGPKLMASAHEIITLPSASVLVFQRREGANRKRAPMAVAVLADPVFGAQDIRVAKAKGNRNKRRRDDDTTAQAEDGLDSGKDQGALATALRDVGLDPAGKLRRLVFSRQEAMAIIHAASPNQSFSALDFKANRATAMSAELSKYRFIHFATHGVLDLDHPELSGIVLSMVDEKGEPQDGYLRLYEIYNLNLPAELVVLSACQTGVGKQIKGEGLIALTRGFMYAGAKSVVASLWQVDDVATSELMAEFYKQMFTNKLKPAAALQAAQLKISKDKRWRSPYYWAGFFLQGEWN